MCVWLCVDVIIIAADAWQSPARWSAVAEAEGLVPCLDLAWHPNLTLDAELARLRRCQPG